MITRKKRVVLPVILLLMLLALTGCKRAWIQNAVQVINPEAKTQSIDVQTEEVSDIATEKATISEMTYNDEDVIYFAYETLEEEDQELYQEILNALVRCDEYIDVSTLDIEKLNIIFNYVMNDHPELFYVDGYQYKKFTLDGEITKIQFFGNYTMDAGQISECKKELEQRQQEILEQLPTTTDQYLLAKAVYEWIIENTEYDLLADNNQNICSVFLTHRSVCQGYAKAFQFLMQKLGIETVLVTGTANQEGHAWNLVKINGNYYYVDVTWGDASYIYADESMVQEVPPINYDYLLVTTDEISKTHMMDDWYQLPDFSHVEDNYYVREHLLLEEYDEELIEQIFQNAYAKGQHYVTIKFSTLEAYDTAKHELMDEQRVFQFVSAKGNKISYTENRQQRTLSFWI